MQLAMEKRLIIVAVPPP